METPTLKPPRGDWSIPRLTKSHALLIIWAFVVQAASRGLDYLVGDDGRSVAVTTIEEAIPIKAWGVLLLAGSAILAAGLLARWWLGVTLGHLILTLIYALLFFGIGVQATQAPWWDGSRGATTLLGPAVVHAVLFWVNLQQGARRKGGRA